MLPARSGGLCRTHGTRRTGVATQTSAMTIEEPDESAPGADVEHDTKGGGPNVCPDCSGTGRVGAEVCGYCRGTGRLENTVA
jgi:hypothetical protein